MTESIGLHVELEGSEIIVTMPGTVFMAAYRKREGARTRRHLCANR
jgi:hypothetical protein